MKTDPGTADFQERPVPSAADDSLPLLPGFREMAARRRLVADLTARRRAAGLSQTEIAARMRTSQSAVARLEAGDADIRMSTLERYAAAVDSHIDWQLRHDSHPPELE